MQRKEWEFFHVGLRRAEWVGLHDGMVIDWSDDCGLTLFVFWNKPQEEELLATCPKSRFEIAFKDVEGIGFFTFRFGHLPWGDCAFSPNLYDTPPVFEKPQAGQTYALNIMVVDTSNGELKRMRVIALGVDFMNQWRTWCLDSLQKNIGRKRYDAVIDMAYEKYATPDQMANEADFRWILNSEIENPILKREERE